MAPASPPSELPPREVPPREPEVPPRTEPGCTSVEVTLEQLRPAVTLLVDQSGSMNQGYPDRESPSSRWSVVREALLDPAKGVVKTLEHSIQFALVFYTSHNGFSGGECPLLSEVSAATNNHQAIDALYQATYPDDDTPTGDAIERVVETIAAAPRKGPEVILLVTDGDPDTCEQPDPQGGQPEAIRAATAAHSADVDFYVLGVSSDIAAHKLQQLANAGQGRPVDAVWGVDPAAAQPFQASDSVEGLTTQFREILARVPLCEVELERQVSVDEVMTGKVLLDGQPLTFGTRDGFRLKDAQHLEIVGKACDALRASGQRLSVRISCD
ncbi:MAG TPA: vWA domain-containing protein [Polyangiaceae bacterium]